MTEQKRRIREKRNLTLNPELVEKLLEVGAASPAAETNLSRLVDSAIAEYVALRWKPEMRRATEKAKGRARSAAK